MRTIVFYKTASGANPVQQFLETLSDKQVEKISLGIKINTGNGYSTNGIF